MKRLLLIVALLIICLVCRAEHKKADFYMLSLNDKTYPDYFLDNEYDDCYLYLLNDGRYCIELEWDASDDIIYMDRISMGNYSSKGDTLYFNDRFTFFKFEAVIKDNVISFTSGFPFLIGRNLKYNRQIMYDYDASHYDRHKSMLSETADSIAFGEPIYPLEFKSYTSVKRYSVPTNININEDETYSLVYGGLLFSKGQWERIGNLIRLKDNNLNHDHYVLIKDGELVMYTIDASCFKQSYK
jgi:hypothetical protein